MKVSTFKKLFSVVEAAEMIMNNWSNEEDNVADLVILPPEKKVCNECFRHGLVIITIAKLYSTKPELMSCAGSSPNCVLLEICNGEDL